MSNKQVRIKDEEAALSEFWMNIHPSDLVNDKTLIERINAAIAAGGLIDVDECKTKNKPKFNVWKDGETVVFNIDHQYFELAYDHDLDEPERQDFFVNMLLHALRKLAGEVDEGKQEERLNGQR